MSTFVSTKLGTFRSANQVVRASKSGWISSTSRNAEIQADEIDHVVRGSCFFHNPLYGVHNPLMLFITR
jgi:hypothetical protein